MVKAPKIFLLDSGLLAHLAGFTSDVLAPGSGLPWGLVETFVLGELLKHLAFSEKGLKLSHYRTQTNIEVKASSSIDGKDFKALRHLKDTEPQSFQRGIILYAGREVVAFDVDKFVVPLSMWWADRQMALPNDSKAPVEA